MIFTAIIYYSWGIYEIHMEAIHMPNPQPRKRLQNLQKGQSLVEMALGLIILLMIVSGLFDFGRLYFTYLALEDAAGEAALYLSVNPSCPRSPVDDPTMDPDCADPNNAYYRARYAVGGSIVDWSRITITHVVDGAPSGGFFVGANVTVSITYPHRLLSPFIPQFTGVNPVSLTTRASQTIITNN
jgi:hypothetical protein